MVSVRSAKSKGSQWELECEYNLKKEYNDIKRLGGIGQFLQYDLISEGFKIVVECKRHKGFSWNELVKIFEKLESKKPKGYTPYLLFKSNRQPALVMYRLYGKVEVCTASAYFSIEWGKRK